MSISGEEYIVPLSRREGLDVQPPWYHFKVELRMLTTELIFPTSVKTSKTTFPKATLVYYFYKFYLK